MQAAKSKLGDGVGVLQGTLSHGNNSMSHNHIIIICYSNQLIPMCMIFCRSSLQNVHTNGINFSYIYSVPRFSNNQHTRSSRISSLLPSHRIRTDFVSNFFCHSHSDLGNVYLLVLSKATADKHCREHYDYDYDYDYDRKNQIHCPSFNHSENYQKFLANQ